MDVRKDGWSANTHAQARPRVDAGRVAGDSRADDAVRPNTSCRYVD